MDLIDISHTQEIYTVSQLNREVRFMLEDGFALLWIEGEISNFAAPHSGHWYFSLKDANAQVRCAMFRPQNRRLTVTPKDGMHVIIKARVSLYEGRGDFQLLVEHLEDAGVGKLQKEFEALKKKLSDAGLFNPAHKKSLPIFPQCIGVITSPTGAAIRDILSVLKRRFPSAPIIIYPTLVQGESASAAIVKALQTANRRQECDVLILARGGGSLEDLWSFNEENVARAIYDSNIPIISGVGHEIDFTIADFVADVRAATPSAAAELVAPDRSELLASINVDKNHLSRLMKQKLQSFQQQLLWTKKHLSQQHPKRRLTEQQQRLDYCEVALTRFQIKLLTAFASRIANLKERLSANTPKHIIRNVTYQLTLQHQQLQNAMISAMQNHQKTLGNLAAKLDALSPLATLKRGFAIATIDKTHQIIRKTSQVTIDDQVNVRLTEGVLICVVKEILSF
jgi:exodeoxyribonuclease VII large subunit